MEISPKTFREVEFREKRHGYHPDDVDQFLEQMATGIEAMQDRMRQAVERAQRAEQVASESGSNDDTLRRTLVLAQRTADLAVQESRDQATRIVSSAEQQAQSLVAEAEDRARRLHGEALADVHAELAKLEAIRAQAQQEVDALNRWAEEHRAHLLTTLQDAVAMIERADVLSTAPASTPIDTPFAPRRQVGPPPAPALPPPGPGDGEARGPAPRPPEDMPSHEARPAGADRVVADVRTPPEPPRPDAIRPDAARPDTARPDTLRPPSANGRGPQESRPPEPRGGPAPSPSAGGPPTQAMPVADQRAARPGEAPERDPLTDPDDQALDSYFEDNDLGDDRRFGGRLRRRH